MEATGRWSNRQIEVSQVIFGTSKAVVCFFFLLLCLDRGPATVMWIFVWSQMPYWRVRGLEGGE